jgi:hypothetical protein
LAAAEGRFEALRSGRLTDFVGREHELGLLIERWNLARSMHEVPERHVPGGFPAKAFSRSAERAWVRKSVPQCEISVSRISRAYIGLAP